MQSIKEQSLIVSAIRVLGEKKEPMEFYALFTLLCDEKDYSKKERAKFITRFYSDITTSAKFVYTGDNHWDLKERQKTELWEKDGSYFKEYTEIKASDYTDINLEEPAPKPKKVRAKKVSKQDKDFAEETNIEEVIVEPVLDETNVVEPVIEITKEEAIEKVAKVTKDAEVLVKEKIAGEDGFVEYEEDVPEEYEDDFDEDKYNEYMDTYEDQYDNKK